MHMYFSSFTLIPRIKWFESMRNKKFVKGDFHATMVFSSSKISFSTVYSVESTCELLKISTDNQFSVLFPN